jgi:hypothetical protein
MSLRLPIRYRKASRNIEPPAGSALSITTQPAGAVDTFAFTTQPVIQLTPATAGVTVTASLASGTGSVAGVATAVTNGSGVATFASLGIDATSPPSSFTVLFTAPGATSVTSSSITVTASSGGVGDDAFSQENILPGSGWQTVTALGWGSPRMLPQRSFYQGDDGGGLLDWGTDWFPNAKHRLTTAITTETTLPLTGPANTTVSGAHSAGALELYVASTTGWDQSHQFVIAGHANPYWVSFIGSGFIRVSRGLDASVSNGAAVTYQSGFVAGQQVLIHNKPTYGSQMGAGTWSNMEQRTISSVPDAYSIIIDTPLSEGRSSNSAVTRRWLDTADVVYDSSYPGTDKNVLRQKLPAGFHGGYFPSKVGRHPDFSGNKLTWAEGQTTGYVYIAGMVWYPGNWTHGKNRGTKWMYMGSSNKNTRFINTTLAAQANAGSTTITVVDDTNNNDYIGGIAAGGKLHLGSTTGELVTVQSRTGTTVTLTALIASTYANGAQVYREGQLAHIVTAFGKAADHPSAAESTTEMWPAYTPQFNPDTNNDVCSGSYLTSSADMQPNGAWHTCEILQEPGTPGVANWRVRIWVDGRLSCDDTGMKLILTDQAIDFNVLEMLPVYGGGLNAVPYDLEVRTGRLLVKVR